MNGFTVANIMLAVLNLFFVVIGVMFLSTGGEWNPALFVLNGTAFLFATVAAFITSD